MKTLLLLPLFALLPFIAFPNGTPEIPKEKKEEKIEFTDTKANENTNVEECTVIAKGTIHTPIGDVTVECTSKHSNCIIAALAAMDCVDRIIDDVVNGAP